MQRLSPRSAERFRSRVLSFKTRRLPPKEAAHNASQNMLSPFRTNARVESCQSGRSPRRANPHESPAALFYSNPKMHPNAPMTPSQPQLDCARCDSCFALDWKGVSLRRRDGTTTAQEEAEGATEWSSTVASRVRQVGQLIPLSTLYATSCKTSSQRNAVFAPYTPLLLSPRQFSAEMLRTASRRK